ncbi:unnamed protein product [Merluccius merluccius]
MRRCRLPDGSSMESLCAGMVGVLSNSESFAEAASEVGVQEGWEHAANDVFCSPDNPSLSVIAGSDEAHNGCLVSKLDNEFGTVHCTVPTSSYILLPPPTSSYQLSCVNKENRRGLSTQAWGVPVLVITMKEVRVSPPHHPGSPRLRSTSSETSLEGMMALNAELLSKNSIFTYMFPYVQVGEGVYTVIWRCP